MATKQSTGAAFSTRAIKGLLARARKTGQAIDRGDGRDHAGLRFRARPSGRGTWSYRYRDSDGRLHLTKIGDWPLMGLAGAREAWRTASEARAKGKRIGEAAEAPTFERVARAYLDAISTPGADGFIRSHGEVTRSLERDAIPTWKSRPAAEITRTDVRGLLHVVGVERSAPRQANRLLAYVRRLFNWAIESEERFGLEANPCASIRRPHEEVTRDRWLKPAELRRFLRDVPTVVSGASSDVLLLMLRTGQRKGEVAGLRWCELELDGNTPTWHLPAERAKNGRAHDVPLPPQAVAILRRWQQRTGGTAHVFHGQRRSKGRPVRGDVVNEAWQRAREGLGLPGLRPHDLRHTVLTHLAKLGCPREVRERIANHSTITSTADRYDHHTRDDEAREWLGRWNVELDRLASVDVVTVASRA